MCTEPQSQAQHLNSVLFISVANEFQLLTKHLGERDAMLLPAPAKLPDYCVAPAALNPVTAKHRQASWTHVTPSVSHHTVFAPLYLSGGCRTCNIFVTPPHSCYNRGKSQQTLAWWAKTARRSSFYPLAQIFTNSIRLACSFAKTLASGDKCHVVIMSVTQMVKRQDETVKVQWNRKRDVTGAGSTASIQLCNFNPQPVTNFANGKGPITCKGIAMFTFDVLTAVAAGSSLLECQAIIHWWTQHYQALYCCHLRIKQSRKSHSKQSWLFLDFKTCIPVDTT